MDNIDLTWGKIRYGWSKFGGGFFGMVKNEGDWFCQACGQKQPEEFPQYMIPTDKNERDFIRICSVCKHIQIKHKLSKYSYIRIIKIVRKDKLYG